MKSDLERALLNALCQLGERDFEVVIYEFNKQWKGTASSIAGKNASLDERAASLVLTMSGPIINGQLKRNALKEIILSVTADLRNAVGALENT
jgi:hypothetical protein